MKDLEKQYYNQKIIWENDILVNPLEKERVDNIIKLIPKDVVSVLDAGCGSGVVVNNLPEKFRKVVGIDFSEESLKYVKTEKVLGTIAHLPFDNKSFDLIICSEVLEHLKDLDYFLAIKELERVAKKYIILTFPNNENLKRSSVICPHCNQWFHPYYHVRKFDSKEIKKIFVGFSLQKYQKIGKGQIYIPDFLVPLLFRIRKPDFLKTSICPFCGYQDSARRENAVLSQSSGGFKIKNFLPRKKRWLITFYTKKQY